MSAYFQRPLLRPRTQYGFALPVHHLQHLGPLLLIELCKGPNEPSYVAGTENFYAITRYNWSSYYAMAVIDLADAVAREFQGSPGCAQLDGTVLIFLGTAALTPAVEAFQ